MPGSPTRATIRDVAALAGVGIKTVSRVINDEPYVSAATRDRVQDAVASLHFRPHEGAGALRRSVQRGHAVGLVLDAVDNPFAAAINRAVEVVATERGTTVFASSSDDDVEHERRLVAALLRRRVDGLVLVTIDTDHSYLARELDEGLRVVFVDRPPLGVEADCVLTAHAAAAAEATEHLLAHGHRRLAYLGDDPRIATAQDRLRGYTETLAGHGLVSTGNRLDLRTEEAATAATLALLAGPEPPTALFTAQNTITVGAVRALHRLGLQHRVALVGFDDLSLADVVEPGITVVAQDVRRIGAAAAAAVLAALDGDPAPPQTTVVPARLVARGSGEISPSS